MLLSAAAAPSYVWGAPPHRTLLRFSAARRSKLAVGELTSRLLPS